MPTKPLLVCAGLSFLFVGCDQRATLEAEATVWLQQNRAGIEAALERGRWVVEHAAKTETIPPARDEAPFYLTYSVEEYEQNQAELRQHLVASQIADWVLEYGYDDLNQAASGQLEHTDLEAVAVWTVIERTAPVIRDSDDPKFAFAFEPGHIRGTVTLLEPHQERVLARLPFEASNSNYAESFKSEDEELNKVFALNRLEDQLLEAAEEAAEEALNQAHRARR